MRDRDRYERGGMGKRYRREMGIRKIRRRRTRYRRERAKEKERGRKR